MNSYNYITTEEKVYDEGLVTWYLLDLVQLLLIFRFFLKLAGANPVGMFTNFIYQVTNVLVSPFVGIANSISIQNAGVFEWSSFFAIFVYYLVAVAIIRLFFTSRVVSLHQQAQVK
ncbi:MAG TPA: YggT family protein [Candidatus Paceibacterota bacterium]|jgi:hypothetical protein|nr:YggT family protein [Candidatus Paceibacterota bacterium]